MKKLISLLTILFVVTGLFSAGPTRVAVDGIYELSLSDTISTGASYRSFLATDTIDTIISNWSPEQGYEYILVHDSCTGAGTDSIALQWRVDAKDGNGVFLYRTAFDTTLTADSNGVAMVIPIRQTSIGHKFDISVQGLTAHSRAGVVTLNRIYIYKRRPLTVQQGWSVGRGGF